MKLVHSSTHWKNLMVANVKAYLSKYDPTMISITNVAFTVVRWLVGWLYRYIGHEHMAGQQSVSSRFYFFYPHHNKTKDYSFGRKRYFESISQYIGCSFKCDGEVVTNVLRNMWLTLEKNTITERWWEGCKSKFWGWIDYEKFLEITILSLCTIWSSDAWTMSVSDSKGVYEYLLRECQRGLYDTCIGVHLMRNRFRYFE